MAHVLSTAGEIIIVTSPQMPSVFARSSFVISFRASPFQPSSMGVKDGKLFQNWRCNA